MSCASLTNLPASTKFPAHSVAGGRELPAYLGPSRLTVPLISAAASEFPFAAIAAYAAAVLYHRPILVYSPDPARFVPQALLIATLDLLVVAVSECLLGPFGLAGHPVPDRAHRMREALEVQPIVLEGITCCSSLLDRITR